MRYELNEMPEGERTGFVSPWFVGTYEVRAGHLHQLGYQDTLAMRSYWPIAQRELPTEFANLARGDEDAVLRFASLYGWPGAHGSVRSITSSARGGSLSLEWVWAHAQTARTCLELMERLQRRGPLRDRALRECLAGLEDAMFAVGDHILGNRGYRQLVHRATPLRVNFQTGESEWVEFEPGVQAVVEAEEVVAGLLTANLLGISRWIHPEYQRQTQGPRFVVTLKEASAYHHRGFRSDFRFESLVQVIYWHVANAATGSRIMRCAAKGCGGLFAQRDPRQRYCPPAIDAVDKDGNGESRCAQRERKRRNRNAVKRVVR